MRIFSTGVFIFFLSVATAGFAAIEDFSFASEEQEARYHKLIAEVRCPMCLNSNLAGSDAPIAADLRAEILEQLEAGRSDREIIDFLKARYGDFITYRPPLNTATVLLWFGPLVLLLAGFFVLRRLVHASRENAAATALSGAEQQQLDAFLQDPATEYGKDQTRT